MKASKQNKDQNLIFEAYETVKEAAVGATADVVSGALSKAGIKLAMSGSEMLSTFRNAFPKVKITPTMEALAKSGKLADKRKLVQLLAGEASLLQRATTAGTAALQATGKMAGPLAAAMKAGAKPVAYTAGGVAVYKIGGDLVDSAGNIISGGESKLLNWIGAPGQGDRAAAAAGPDLGQQADDLGLAPGTQERSDFIQAGQDQIKRQEAMGGLTGMFKKFDPKTGTASYDPAKVAGGLAVGTAGAIGAKAAYDWATKDKDEDERRGRA